MTDIPTITRRLAANAASTTAPRASKSATVIKLLSRAKGASLGELQNATGWQAHSCRAFLTGLRKKGKELLKKQRPDGSIAYHIAAAPMDTSAA